MLCFLASVVAYAPSPTCTMPTKTHTAVKKVSGKMVWRKCARDQKLDVCECGGMLVVYSRKRSRDPVVQIWNGVSKCVICGALTCNRVRRTRRVYMYVLFYGLGLEGREGE
jgi:hypothetical protein